MSAADDSKGPRVLLTEDYDPDGGESFCARIVRLVAVAADRNPNDLTPLGRVIDADALERFVGSAITDKPKTGVALAFDYEGYRIDIEADGTVSILAEEE